MLILACMCVLAYICSYMHNIHEYKKYFVMKSSIADMHIYVYRQVEYKQYIVIEPYF